MAFVSSYSHDVFISYAHVDDEPIGAATQGWVTTLLGQLQSTVDKRLGRRNASKIWMDHEMKLNQGVTTQLMEAVGQTALLVVVLSRGYLVSDWCRKEADTFLKEIASERRAGSRVFLVELAELDRGKRPKELQDLPTYRFWAQGRPGETPSVFCEAGLTNADPHYFDYITVLNKLATDLAGELTALVSAPVTQVRAAELQALGAPAVFVASVTDDLIDLHDEVRSYLDQLNVKVLPDRPYARDESFAQSMEKDLAGCKVFVQLLSGLQGMRVSGDRNAVSYPRLQYDMAKKSGKTILQWRDEALVPSNVANADQRALVQTDTVRAEGIEDFKREIKRVLFEPAPKVVQPRSGQALRALVFVDSDPNDWDLGQEIRSWLIKRGVDVALPTWDQPPDAVRADLEDNLTQCNALIVVYGKTSVTWVRSQLLLCRKVIAKRDQPLEALGLYQGPPENKPPLNLDLHNLRLIDCTQARLELMEAQLQQFINQLATT